MLIFLVFFLFFLMSLTLKYVLFGLQSILDNVLYEKGGLLDNT